MTRESSSAWRFESTTRAGDCAAYASCRLRRRDLAHRDPAVASFGHFRIADERRAALRHDQVRLTAARRVLGAGGLDGPAAVVDGFVHLLPGAAVLAVRHVAVRLELHAAVFEVVNHELEADP